MSAVLTVDLGYGDAGKGTIVDALVRKTRANLVVRYNGGAQCAHNVVTDDGMHHNFHQFGSGTLAGCDTLLGPEVRVNPREFLRERHDLTQTGATAVYVDERCLITTPWHMALNRIRENARTNRHGSCGMGVGETVQYSLNYVDAPRVRDLVSDFIDKLELVYHRLKTEADTLLLADSSTVSQVFKVSSFQVIVDEMKRFRRQVFILDHGQVLEMLQKRDTVFEGAQGVLLDEDWGFHPYTTWSHTTLLHAEELATEAGLNVTQRLGIIRSYMTRHGAGPLTGEIHPEVAAFKKLTEAHNDTNEWQQHWRVAPADLTAWNYAVRKCPGLDTLAITHMDKVDTSRWDIQDSYSLDHFDRIKPDDFAAREHATTRMMQVTNRVYAVMSHAVLDVISTGLRLPVYVTSHGPKSGDKKFYH